MSDADELRAMLGIKPGSTKPAKSELVIKKEKKKSRPIPQSEDEIDPQAIHMDKWDLASGKDCWQHRYPGWDPNMHLPPANASPEEMADFFAMMYVSDPQLTEFCANPHRQEFVRSMMESPEYRQLRTSTTLNYNSSEIAANSIADKWQAIKVKEWKNDESIEEEIQTMREGMEALQEASKEVEQCEEAMKAMGGGFSSSGGRGSATMLEVKKVAALFERIKNDSQLRAIFELAGRYRMLAQSKQRKKFIHGNDDLIGIELGGDLGRLIPPELALFDDPQTEMDALRRFADRQSMQYAYRGIEPIGRGPVVVCVDESGSMSGSRIHNAKALALALAWIAKHQKRWCCLMNFASKGDCSLLTMPPNKWNELALCDWLTHFYGGDTYLPLESFPDYWKTINPPKGKTDIVFITDADLRLQQETIANFNSWRKRESVRTISIIISSSAGNLIEVSDEVNLVSTLNLNSAGVDAALSI